MTQEAPLGILSAIGNTPLVELRQLAPALDAQVFGKLERFNPSGSIKDRPAITMLLDRIHSGELEPGKSVVVESSSGNLAISIAQICRYFGIRFVCVVDAKTTEHNIAILRALEVDVELITDPDETTGEYLPARLRRVQELLASTPGAFWPNQYANPDNPRAHQQTMHEIAEALDRQVDFLFCATSTTGTLSGCADYVREHGLSTKIIAVDAVGSCLFEESRTIQRLLPGHGASIRPALCDPTKADRVVHVTDLECVTGCRRLIRREAILAGGSSGATVAALEKIGGTIPRGSTCVLIFPDGGERYLDTIYSDTWVTEHFGEVSYLWKDLTEVTNPC